MNKNNELYNVYNILSATMHLEEKKEKLELIKLYLKATRKEELYNLIIKFSTHNFEVRGQIELVKKYLQNKEDNKIISIIDSYFPRGNPAYINDLIDIYVSSTDQIMMYRLLTEPSVLMFRRIEEIIELSKLYENVLKSVKFYEEMFENQVNSVADLNVYSIITDYEINMNEDYKLEDHQKIIFNYLNENEIPTINFTRKVKSKC